MVSFATLRACGEALFIELKPMAIFAYPTNLARGVAYHKSIGGYLFGYHSTCTNQGVCTDVMATYYSCVCTDRSTTTNVRRHILVFAANGTSRIGYICKHTARAQEHIVVARNAGVDRHIVLHLHIIAQHNTGRNNHVLPNVTPLPYRASCHYMREMPDTSTLPDSTTGVNNCRLMCLIVHVNNHLYIKNIVGFLLRSGTLPAQSLMGRVRMYSSLQVMSEAMHSLVEGRQVRIRSSASLLLR